MMDRIDHDARDGERHSRRRVLGTAAGLAAAAGGTALAACGPEAPAGTAGGSTAAPVEVIWTSWAIDDLGLKFREMPRAALFLAGLAHQQYRRGSAPSGTVLADFFIGAHAAVINCGIITRDVRRYRNYFPRVPLVSPAGY